MIAPAERIRVELGDARSYDVVIGAETAAEIAAFAARACVVLYDLAVEPLAQRVVGALGGRAVLVRGLTGGEEIKTLASAGELYDALGGARIDRDALLIAIGGGTVTDLGGFVAATYNRGIAWCAIPTTLLAAVDAAVGGKTGINIDAGKNLVGAFHHPSLVAIDPAAFATLDRRDLVAGLAEAVKTAIVADPELFALLERDLDAALAADPDVLARVVAHCVRAKARIVAGDERDLNDVRAVLNFGHTIGHALEKMCGYGELRHGEAVGLGMKPALALSRARGLPDAAAARMEALVARLPLPAVDAAPDALIAAAGSDKKRKGGRVRFVLVRDLAQPYVDGEIDEPLVRRALATLC